MLKTVPFKTIQFSLSTQFNCRKLFYFKLFSLVKHGLTPLERCSRLNNQTVLFQTILLGISTQFSSILPTNMTLLGATTLG